MTPDPFDPFDQLVAETPPEVLAAGHKWVKQQFYGDTMYIDYHLKFTDQAEADAVLFDECKNGKLRIGAFCFKLSASGKDKELIVASVIGRGTNAIVLARPTPRAHLVSSCIDL